MKTSIEIDTSEKTQEEPGYARWYGRDWVRVLVEQYGDDLRGLTLDQLAQLPDIGWEQSTVVHDSLMVRLKRKLGRIGIKHPSEPSFSFEDCADFFDGASYLAALRDKYGENLEHMPNEVWRQLPVLENADRRFEPIETRYLRRASPAERVDALRQVEVFLRQSREDFEEQSSLSVIKKQV